MVSGTGNLIGDVQAGKDATGGYASDASDGNLIAFNRGDGVRSMDGTAANPVRGNSMFGNGVAVGQGQGIDLNGDGPTANDTPDGNGLQNFPSILRAILAGDDITIIGKVPGSTLGNLFVLDFFANSIRDASGHWEGAVYLGSVEAPGAADFQFTFPKSRLPSTSPYLTATATDAGGHTSEFSFAFKVEGDIPTVVPLPSPALMSLAGVGLIAAVHFVRSRRRAVR